MTRFLYAVLCAYSVFILTLTVEAQPIAFRDTTQHYTRDFRLIDKQTLEPISSFYSFIDSKYFNASNYFIYHNKYGYEFDVGLLNSKGEVALPSDPRVEIFIDTSSRLIYRQFKNYREVELIGIEVLNLDLEVLNYFEQAKHKKVYYSPNRGLQSDAYRIKLKHRNGIDLYNKRLDFIEGFQDSEQFKYKGISKFINGYATVACDSAGYDYVILIDILGNIVFRQSNSEVRRLNANEFRLYSYEKDETTLLKIENGLIRKYPCTSQFKDYEYEISSSSICLGTNWESKRYKTSLIRKNTSCGEEILIEEIDDDVNIQEFSISKNHYVHDSKGGMLSKFRYCKDINGDLYAIDKYDQLIPFQKRLWPINFYRLRTSDYHSFDSLWVYSLDGEYFCFNPQNPNKSLRTLGPYQSISLFNSLSYRDPKFVLTKRSGETDLLYMDSDHWYLKSNSRELYVFQLNNLLGVKSNRGSRIIIQPEYEQIDEFHNLLFCKKPGDNFFQVFNREGLALVNDIYEYQSNIWSNTICSDDERRVIVKSAFTKKYGLIKDEVLFLPAEFDYFVELPNGKWACHIYNRVSFVLNQDGTVFNQSDDYYIAYNCEKNIYYLKGLKPNSDNVYPLIKEFNTFNLIVKAYSE